MHATDGLRLAAACRAVLVPLDGSEDAERALGPGEWLAEHFGAELHVVTADVHADERFWYEPYLKDIIGEALPATAHCTDDTDVPGAIRATARSLDPCLMCIATHGRSRTAAVLGSTFARLAVTGEEPLVAIGPKAFPHFGPDPRRLVVCVDRGPLSERLVDRAAMWARAFDHDLTLVTVTDDHDRDTEAAAIYVRRLAADPNIDDLAVDALVLAGSGGPHAVLARHLAKRPTTLVAVATRGRTGMARAVLGSEAARIIHHSPVPVLVLPPATVRDVGPSSLRS
jgi:nucleotide-binding universal stress UspA family protein